MVIVASEDTRNAAWAKDQSGFGQRMLAKMGWGEGKGLGKDGQGMTSNLRGVRTDESLGIGAKTDSHGSDGWEKTRNNFQSILSSLAVEHGTSSKKKKKSKKKKGKNGELTLARNKVTAGHAKKMRAAKDINNKSQADMAAIFGVRVEQYVPKVRVGDEPDGGERNKSKKSSKRKRDAARNATTSNTDDKKTILHTASDIPDDKKERKRQRKEKKEQAELNVVDSSEEKKSKKRKNKSKISDMCDDDSSHVVSEDESL